jgi:hypothetical protein
VAPQAVVQVLQDQLTKLSNGDHAGLFSLGVLMAISSSSAAMVSIIDAMNRAYDITESRSWWKVRLTCRYQEQRNRPLENLPRRRKTGSASILKVVVIRVRHRRFWIRRRSRAPARTPFCRVTRYESHHL